MHWMQQLQAFMFVANICNKIIFNSFHDAEHITPFLLLAIVAVRSLDTYVKNSHTLQSSHRHYGSRILRHPSNQIRSQNDISHQNYLNHRGLESQQQPIWHDDSMNQFDRFARAIIGETYIMYMEYEYTWINSTHDSSNENSDRIYKTQCMSREDETDFYGFEAFPTLDSKIDDNNNETKAKAGASILSEGDYGMY
jgi:hypothetical protein